MRRKRDLWGGRVVGVVLGVCILLLSGCRDEVSDGVGERIEVKVKGENVKVELRLSDVDILSSELIDVDLRVFKRSGGGSWEGVNGTAKIGPMWGDFLVLGMKMEPAVLADNGWTVRRSVFQIEPDVPGAYMLPPLEFYASQGDGSDGDVGEAEAEVVKTPEISVKVGSVIDEQSEMGAGFQDISDGDSVRSVEGAEDAEGVVLIWVIRLAVCGGVFVGLVLLVLKLKRGRSGGRSGDVWGAKGLGTRAAYFIALGDEFEGADLLRELEPAFCAAFEELAGEDLLKNDFDGVRAVADGGLAGDIFGLIGQCERLKYGREAVLPAEVEKLYRGFVMELGRVSSEGGRK